MREYIKTYAMMGLYYVASGCVWMLSEIVSWLVAVVCFVIGLVGVVTPVVMKAVVEFVIFVREEYVTIRRKAEPQVLYLCDFRNDILRQCGRGDAYEHEDEF
mgnify:CR=1 FL=1